VPGCGGSQRADVWSQEIAQSYRTDQLDKVVSPRVGGSSPEPCSRLGKVGSRLDFSPHFLFGPAPLCRAQPEQLHMASLQVKAFGIGNKYTSI